MSRNYQLVYYVAQKWVNYRDTGVSKNIQGVPEKTCFKDF